MWQRRTLSTPLVRHVRLSMRCGVATCSLLSSLIMAADKSRQSYNLWKDNTDLLYGKKFFQKADQFFKVCGKFV